MKLVSSSPRIATSQFQFTRLVDGAPHRIDSLAAAFNQDQKLAGECWMFVSPHDDDLAIGAGLLMQAAVAQGVDVQCVIVTDGCLGYCRASQQADIVRIRHRETVDSFEILGIDADHLTFLGFPDGGLTQFIGRRRAGAGEPDIAGYTGLQNGLTHYLRELRPVRVFVPTRTDLHPDHQITHNELMISLFHASGKIWPELGDPLPLPEVHELAIYCDFPSNPDLEIKADAAAFKVKLDSIKAYRSQLQIAELVKSQRKGGPFEYIRDVSFRLYSPRAYRSLFEVQ